MQDTERIVQLVQDDDNVESTLHGSNGLALSAYQQKHITRPMIWSCKDTLKVMNFSLGIWAYIVCKITYATGPYVLEAFSAREVIVHEEAQDARIVVCARRKLMPCSTSFWMNMLQNGVHKTLTSPKTSGASRSVQLAND